MNSCEPHDVGVDCDVTSTIASQEGALLHQHELLSVFPLLPVEALQTFELQLQQRDPEQLMLDLGCAPAERHIVLHVLRKCDGQVLPALRQLVNSDSRFACAAQLFVLTEHVNGSLCNVDSGGAERTVPRSSDTRDISSLASLCLQHVDPLAASLLQIMRHFDRCHQGPVDGDVTMTLSPALQCKLKLPGGGKCLL